MDIKSNNIKNQVYIRAPLISKVGENVEILYKYDNIITGVKNNNMIGVTFHPEIINDIDFYKKIFFDNVIPYRNHPDI